MAKKEAKEKAPLSPHASRALKGLRTAAILFASLIILLVGAGVLYVWLGSSEAPAAVIAEPKAKAQLKEKTAPTLDPKAPKALTDFGFGTLRLAKIIIKADPDNLPSNKVAEKLGYELERIEGDPCIENPANVWSKATTS